MITLSFDDGRKDNFDFARPLLSKYHIPATFNITTAYIEKGVLHERQLPEPAMSVEEVKALASSEDFEIASHSHHHCNDWDDIIEGHRRLREWLGVIRDKPIGFASPGSQMKAAYIRENQNMLREMGCLYVRTDYRIENMRILRVLARKAGRVVHWPWLYAFAYEQTLQSSIEDMTVFSVPVLRETTLKQLICLIELAKKRRQACTILFHGILPEGQTCSNMTWGWKAESFEALLEYLSAQREAGALELMTTEQLYRRLGTERNT